MKGISAVIASIMLLLITIALAGAAYIFFMGYYTTAVSKIFTVSGVQCSGPDNALYLVITNPGTTPIKKSDFIAIRIIKTGEGQIPITINPDDFTIEPQKAIEINITSPNITTGSSYSIYIATASRSDEKTIIC
ncbi:MAG: archaellin/type IV pilin N-terminal domain-containing protein [Candidatus Aenigmatarchaeota archaeon]